jgi:hypothetical protein
MTKPKYSRFWCDTCDTCKRAIKVEYRVKGKGFCYSHMLEVVDKK